MLKFRASANSFRFLPNTAAARDVSGASVACQDVQDGATGS